MAEPNDFAGRFLGSIRRKVDLRIAKEDLESKKLANQKAANALKASDRFRELMEDTEPSAQRRSPAARLSDLANRAVTAGAWDTAKKLSDMASSSAAAEKSSLDLSLKQLDYADRALGGVVDQASFDAAVEDIEREIGPGSGLRGTKYSPQGLEQIRRRLVSSKTRAEIDLKKADLSAKKTNESLARTRQALAESRKRYVDERTKRLKKAGAKEVTAPTKGEVEQAMLIMGREYPNMDAGEAGEAAFAIASRAKQLKRQNTALDVDAAIRQAFGEAVEAGEFSESSRQLFGVNIPGTGKTDFVTEGKTAQDPLELPEDRKLIADRYYNTSRGVALWTGKEFTGAE